MSWPSSSILRKLLSWLTRCFNSNDKFSLTTVLCFFRIFKNISSLSFFVTMLPIRTDFDCFWSYIFPSRALEPKALSEIETLTSSLPPSPLSAEILLKSSPILSCGDRTFYKAVCERIRLVFPYKGLKGLVF